MSVRQACAACSQEGEGMKRCSRCKSVHYCTPACQRAHWPHHRALCRPPAPSPPSLPQRPTPGPIRFNHKSPSRWPSLLQALQGQSGNLQVAADTGTGHGLRTGSTALSPGDLLWAESPYVIGTQAAEQQEEGRECGACGRPAPFVDVRSRRLTPPVACRQGCAQAFCSGGCEAWAWGEGVHAWVCPRNRAGQGLPSGPWRALRAYVQRTGYRYPLMMALLVVRTLTAQREGRTDAVWDHLYVPPLDHAEPLAPKWAQELALLRHLFQDVLDAQPYMQMEIYLQVCAMFRANALFVRTHGVTHDREAAQQSAEAGRWSEGPGLFLLASLMNHSCHPTVEIVRTASHRTEFRAREALPPHTELTIDYLGVHETHGALAWGVAHPHTLPEDLLLTIVERFAHRQGQMKDSYHCFCACRLCQRDWPLSRLFA